MAPKKVIAEPRSAVEIADSIKLVRQLIQVADLQIERAKTDLGVARVGLAELEEELSVRGIGGSK
jgi:hypothetical protein